MKSSDLYTSLHAISIELNENPKLIELRECKKSNKILRKALENWLLDHGHRCRICSEKTQQALKGEG
jgi:hypothetical protein